MRETRFQPWLCARCGYMMDAASPASPLERDISPGEGDISICLNCGAHYSLRAGKWAPLAPAERERLPAELKAELLRFEIARLAVVDRDLSKRDPAA